METTTSSGLLRMAREILAKRAAMAEEEGAESGFTLIELMVVLLIMAILLAIAIPTFLGVKSGAQDRAAQSNLSNALISAKAIYANGGSYPSGMVASLSSQEPALSFLASNVAPPTSGSTNQISVDAPSGGQLVLVAYSPANGGTCWAVSDWDGTGSAVGAVTQGTLYNEWKPGTITAGTNDCAAATAEKASVGNHWATKYPTSTTQTAP